MKYNNKLVKEYQEYMLKLGEEISNDQAQLDLDSLSTVFLSFALDEYHTKKDEE